MEVFFERGAMRKTLDKVLLAEVLEELGRLARGPGKVYLAGGACAYLWVEGIEA